MEPERKLWQKAQLVPDLERQVQGRQAIQPHKPLGCSWG